MAAAEACRPQGLIRRTCFEKRVLVITLLVFISSTVFDQCLARSLLKEGKEHVVQAVWNELTPSEVRHIFGDQVLKRHSQDNVPKLDVIRPELTLASRRSRRSIQAELENAGSSHLVLEGLGTEFNLSLKANADLVDKANFVYLLRDGNETEIIDRIRLENHLDCFYHGRSAEQQVPEKNARSYYSDGAINVCGGVSGFLRHRHFDAEQGYIIHPIPPRLHGSKFHNHEMDSQHHFLYKLEPSTSRSRRSAEGSEEEPACAHKTSGKRKRRFAESSPYRPRSIALDSYWLRHRTPAPSLRAFPTRQYFPVDDTLKGRQRRQNTRAEEYAEDTSGSKELHWVERTDSGGKFGSFRYSNGAERNPSESSTFTARRVFRLEDMQHSESFLNQRRVDFSEPLSYGTVTRPVSPSDHVHRPTLPPGLTAGEIANIFESNPSEHLPFVTTRNNGFVEFETEETRAYADDGSKERIKNSFYSKNRNRNDTLSREFPRNQWVTFSSSPTVSTLATTLRRGRHDEEIFGENWKSSLDSEISWTEEGDQQNGKWSSAQSRNEAPQEVQVLAEPAHLTIETAVFIDKDLFKHMQSNFPEDTHGEVTRIVLAMINAVQLLYQDPSLGHRVDFVLKRLEVLATDPPGLLRPLDIDRFLTNFCKWQRTENPPSDADPLHWDHALILTGLDLYVVHQSGKISNQVVGLAPVAGMCTRSSSCTVNEGRHFESVYVVAHEIGHNLGMRHDGPQADNDCDPTSHIMSPTLGSGKITWSSCSKRYLDNFLETSQSKCLLDKAKSESRLDHDADGRLPGERFDADRQCVLKYGRGSYHAVQQPLEDVCRDLHCRKEHYTWTSHPALEGTFCGFDMWCRAGKCVSRSSKNHNFDHGLISNSVTTTGSDSTAAYSSLKPVDGGWSNWSPFTDCSSACLVSDQGTSIVGSTGIQLAARRCGSPRPDNGGRQCPGEDRKYKICDATKVCSETSRPTTTEYANEVCTRAASVDTGLTGRGFMTNTNDAERACSVWCETNERGGSRSRGWTFPDGTACKLISKPGSTNFCVAGKCQEFTCNSSSYYRLSEEDCEPSRAAGDSKAETSNAWFGNRLDSTGSHSSRIGVTSSRISSLANSVNSRSPKAGWGTWEAQSECKLACLAPAKGLELVKRSCHASSGDEGQCSGLGLSVRLCRPASVSTINCPRVQTPFEYATKVCGKYAEKIKGLSGIGMQLSPTGDDKDRPCRIGCQDENVSYRFYMVNGEEGWFPAGTDCSRGEPSKKAFCMGGKCVDFNPDDTPKYRLTEKLLGTIETFITQRNKRQAHHSGGSGATTWSLLDQSSLKSLVDQFPRSPNQEATSYFFGRRPVPTVQTVETKKVPFDFNRPVTVADTANLPRRTNYTNNRFDKFADVVSPETILSKRTGDAADAADLTVGRGSIPGSKWPIRSDFVEGSFYQWRQMTSDCSVSCGSGMRKSVVQCISGETVVDDSLCSSRARPGASGLQPCHRAPCPSQQTSFEPRRAYAYASERLLPRSYDRKH